MTDDLARRRAERDPCPVSDERVHDFAVPMADCEDRAPFAWKHGAPVPGYSCRLCHKTWDREWTPTYSSAQGGSSS